MSKAIQVMNKLLCIILFLSIWNMTYAHDNKIEEFRKYIKKYDMRDSIKDNLIVGDASSYWRAIMDKNKRYQEALEAATKGKKSAKVAQKNMRDAMQYAYEYAKTFDSVNYMNPLIDSLVAITGINDIYREAQLYVIHEPVENAFVFANGSAYITDALMNRLNFDVELLIGVYAHELVHFTLQHMYAGWYYGDIKKRKNDLLADVFSGLTVGAIVAADMYAATNGVQPPKNRDESYQRTIDSFKKEADRNTEKFRIKYSKEQEYEADILAYRFCEWIGIGGNKYIDALRLIQSDLEIFYQSDTHPLTSDRIALLEYMATNPTFKPKKKMPVGIHDDIYR